MPHILLQDLMDDSIDLIVGNPWKVVDVSGVDIKELGQLSLAIIVRSGHPLAGKKGLTLADLAGFPAASGMEGYSAFDKHSGALVCENHFILRELTLQSDCYWQTAVALVHSDIESGKLVKLDMFGRTEDRTVVNLMTRRNRTHSPATIAVAREILKIITDLRDADSGPLAQRRFDGWRQNG